MIQVESESSYFNDSWTGIVSKDSIELQTSKHWVSIVPSKMYFPVLKRETDQ